MNHYANMMVREATANYCKKWFTTTCQSTNLLLLAALIKLKIINKTANIPTEEAETSFEMK